MLVSDRLGNSTFKRYNNKMKTHICIQGGTLIEVLISLLLISLIIRGSLELQHKAQQISTDQYRQQLQQQQQRDDYETGVN